MVFNKTNLSVWPCLHLKHLIPFHSPTLECVLCRIGGIIILSISTICLIFNIRYFIWYQHQKRRNTLVLSLFLGSFLIIIISAPGALLQLFSCHRLCNGIYCRIEGFTSYFCGCLCMLIYMTLSVNRYLLLCQYNHPLLYHYAALICWILSIGWTLPPTFDYWISYIPEGLGFHCSINWNDHSTKSFYYIFFSFLIFYFIPLIILFIVNLRVHQIIRTIYSSQNLDYSNQKTVEQKNPISLNQRKSNINKRLDNRLNITSSYVRKAADLKRLKIEYRFVKAIIFLVGAYVVAWTPYSIVAVLQLFNVDFIFQYAFFITISAFIAKLSVMLAPLFYLSIMSTRLCSKILFQ
jgi:hypothetical protein